MFPAVGQGALGLECRADDAATLALLGPLNDGPTRQAVLAERALLRGLGGGCLVPIGARAVVEGDRLTLRAAVLAPDGSRRVADEAEGPAVEAEPIGKSWPSECWRKGRGSCWRCKGSLLPNVARSGDATGRRYVRGGCEPVILVLCPFFPIVKCFAAPTLANGFSWSTTPRFYPVNTPA